MASLIYGGGLRVSECCELRVKDLDFANNLILVRSGKGDKDRSTLLPESGRDALRAHLRGVEALYEADRRTDLAGVWLPESSECRVHIIQRSSATPARRNTLETYRAKKSQASFRSRFACRRL